MLFSPTYWFLKRRTNNVFQPQVPNTNPVAVKSLDHKISHVTAAFKELQYPKPKMEASFESVDSTAALNNHVCPTSIAHIQARIINSLSLSRLERR